MEETGFCDWRNRIIDVSQLKTFFYTFKLDPRLGIVSRQSWKTIRFGGLSYSIGGGYVSRMTLDRYFN